MTPELYDEFPDQNVSIVGMGYVGLTLAVVMADVGFNVHGSEVRDEVLDLLERGKPHFFELGLQKKLENVTGSERLTFGKRLDRKNRSSVFVITVGTPLDDQGNARLDMIRAASEEVAQCMDDGALVILRSTVKIGTARNIVAPILKNSGKSFEIACCPERTLEGAALEELRKIPQIVGADNPRTIQRAAQVFGHLTPTIVKVGKLEAAETIKLVDNTYRDVTFAFGNEVARLCDSVGISAHDVIEGGKLGYSRTNVAMPGPVGGPCLEKDPHILVQSLKQKGMDLDITAAARAVNERQPAEVVGFLSKLLAVRKVDPDKAVIVLAGLAFKGRPETDDLRGTMAVHVLTALKEAMPNAQFRGYDPVVKSAEIAGLGLAPFTSMEPAFENADLVVVLNNHSVFKKTTLDAMLSFMPASGVIYDFWGAFPPDSVEEDGSRRYFSLGNHCFAELDS